MRLRARAERLTAEEERDLARAAQSGDARARDRLVRANLPLVASVVGKHARRTGADADDCLQEGSIGLLRAVEKYDPDRGIRFGTYAVFWIRATIARFSGRIRSSDVSLDEDADGSGEGATTARALASEGPGQSERVERAEVALGVRRALQRCGPALGGLGLEIVRARLSTDSPATLEQIGDSFGLSRERVRQVEAKTIAKLRRILAEVDA